MIVCQALQLNDCSKKELPPVVIEKPKSHPVYEKPVPVTEILKSTEPKVLSSYKTKYEYTDKFETRAYNIELAASKLNGLILEPNVEFSFNDTIGPRDEEHGYKKAIVLFLGEKTKDLGGGTCQVSSTLYSASMLGGLKVTRRASHSRPSDYIPKGFDATVSYPDLDLKFVNELNVPLTIKAQAGNGELEISIVGAEKDFTLKYYYQGGQAVPFTKRIIWTKYHRGAPQRKQKGSDGIPGIMWWTYKFPGGAKKQLRVFSSYKPIDEVWHAKPGDELPEE